MSRGDQEVVRREFGTDERYRARRLDRWAVYLGPDPRQHALLAVLEACPRRVLDAGAGDGEFAEWVARRLTSDVVAVDQSAWMAGRAEERGLPARVAEIGALPCEDAEFDVVVANWVLYFLADLDAGLADLARVLRPGGRLVALTNSRRHLEELWGEQPMSFDAENGAAALERQFARVERRDVEGSVVFPTREAVRRYVEAFSVLGTRPAVDVDGLVEPFRATTRNAVFVAETR
ncbi:MAG: class I SAM-dependent methyltransferase [Gaiellaceae bacterium]